MALTIKQKLVSGVVFQLLLLMLLGGFGLYYIVELRKDSSRILKNNYESLDYAHHMQSSLLALESGPSSDTAKALKEFENNLKFQEQNITEPGEGEVTGGLRRAFDSLRSTRRTGLGLVRPIQVRLQEILHLNMAAIEKKNAKAQATAEDATTFITVLSTITLIISLGFVFSFSSLFTDPINRLKAGIAAIGRKDYTHRVHVEGNDEFRQLADAFNDLAERLNAYEHSNLNRILFEKSRAEAVINSLKDPSFGVDRDGRILFANEQTLRILGITAPEIIEKTMAEVSARNDLFRFLVTEERNTPFKVVEGGQESFYTMEVNDIHVREEVLGKVYTLKNITHFREKDEAKTHFLATISHELKTPLASTDIGLKLLEQERIGGLSEAQKEILSDLRKDNQRLLKLVSELMDLSQVETGNMRLRLETVSAETVVQVALQAIKQSAQDKKLSLDWEPAKDLQVMADKDKLTLVILNLLSNAVKFSPEGEHVTIVAHQDGNKVRLTVTDKGPGIPVEYHARIFERFFKVPGSQQFRKGTGLGLSISREFMEAMNGDIGLVSEPGSGSSFWVEIPLAVKPLS